MMPTGGMPPALSNAELLDAVITLSTAFEDDPLWLYIYPDRQERQQALSGFFRSVLALSIRQQKAYGIGSPPTGVAVWDFPGQPRSPLSVAAFAPLLRLAFSPFALAAFKVRRVFAQFERMRKTHAGGPHAYLQTVGIRPDSQGQGLASQLIRPFLLAADGSGLGCYTETVTPSNVSIYQHYGFKVVEDCTVPGIPLRLWGFYRSASR
jgi:ribosomal protein S18 acetylase RimI-like enzyme